MKTISLRIDESLIPEKGINDHVTRALEYYKYVTYYADRELKDYFTKREETLLFASLNGTLIEGQFRYYVDALVAHVEDYFIYDTTEALQFGVDKEALVNKVRSMSASQVESLYRKAEDFWNSLTARSES